jgi:hypothetical protein
MNISLQILFTMKNVSNIVENQNTVFIFNNGVSINRAVYEITWKNMVQPDRPQMTIKYRACALHAG